MAVLKNCAGETLRRCAAGNIPPNVALMQLCRQTSDPPTARELLSTAIENSSGPALERLLELDALWQNSPDAFDVITRVCQAESRMDGGVNSVDEIAAAFDRANQICPAGSVALYSLGREDLLNKATAEAVAYLRSEHLLGLDRRALEIGCGIGRFLTALAPEMASVTGVDISRQMLMEARRRCKNYRNVTLWRGNGRSFPNLPSRSFHLALAIDVFPYLVIAGEDVVVSNLQEVSRVLQPNGRLLIFNFSYRGDESDGHEVFRLATCTGYDVQRSGARPFRWWDGIVFDLARKE
jgi:ubiquinone/menaquinone biosynthesis C-methylase UbiE